MLHGELYAQRFHKLISLNKVFLIYSVLRKHMQYTERQGSTYLPDYLPSSPPPHHLIALVHLLLSSLFVHWYLSQSPAPGKYQGRSVKCTASNMNRLLLKAAWTCLGTFSVMTLRNFGVTQETEFFERPADLIYQTLGPWVISLVILNSHFFTSSYKGMKQGRRNKINFLFISILWLGWPWHHQYRTVL